VKFNTYEDELTKDALKNELKEILQYNVK